MTSQHEQFVPAACDRDIVQISIVVPAYNMGSLLADTLTSVFAQTDPAEEVIVVNNGSTDNTDEIVAPFLDRIHYHTIMPNAGVSRARNAGADRATGNWLLFLDGDDRLFPGALGALRDRAAQGGAGLVYGRVEQLDTTTEQRRERTYPGLELDPPGPARKNFWRSLIPSPGAAIIHRRVHDIVGGFTKPWQPTEDRDYWIKCGMTTRFAFCDAMVLEKLYRPSSMRVFSDQAVFWGMKVQFEFLEWCRDRGLATDFLETTDAAIVAHALRRAVDNEDAPVIRQILDYAGTRNLTTPLWPRLKSWWILAQSRRHESEATR